MLVWHLGENPVMIWKFTSFPPPPPPHLIDLMGINKRILFLNISFSHQQIIVDSVVEEDSVTEVKEWKQLETLLDKAQTVFSQKADGKLAKHPLPRGPIESKSADCCLGNTNQVVGNSNSKSKTGLKSKPESLSRARSSKVGPNSKTISKNKLKSKSCLEKTKGAAKGCDASGCHGDGQLDGKHLSVRLDHNLSGRCEMVGKVSRGRSLKCSPSQSAQRSFSIQQNG